jgi:Xaa-Pro aminopeptidase
MFRLILIGVIWLQAALCAAADSHFYATRRDALMKKIDGSVAVLEGAPGTRSYTRFRQDNNFYYLTGVETPNALLMLDASRHLSILFLPPADGKTKEWEGPRLFAGSDSRSETGIDEVLELSQFGEELEKRKSSFHILYTPLSPQEVAATSRDRALQYESARLDDPWDGRISREAAFEKNLREKVGGSVTIKDLSPILDDMRRVKDAQEVELLRESGRISALGLREAIRASGPGMFEYQAAALAEFIFVWHGASGPAFFPIVGSGPNSCFIHYHLNRRRMASGDVAVMDFGSDFGYYASDITRTFPVSGRFNEEQARVYRVVLDAQKAALAKIRPGATFDDLDKAVHEVLKRHDYYRYLPHGVSHYVGMAVHDVGESKPFEPGVVVTIEPGVYIPEKNLGVRIEDTVLITKDGCEVLTKEAPKEITEIEKLMAGNGIAGIEKYELNTAH